MPGTGQQRRYGAQRHGLRSRDGYSVTYDAPYAEAIFGVKASSFEGPVMILDLVAVEGRHRAIQQAQLRRDLLPALCA